MGTDIHLQIEVKINGGWKWINSYLPLGICKWAYIPLDTNRNYYLFSMLANVRNGDMFEPISEPKGLPEDISDELYDYYYKGNLGDHSYSYLNAKELKDYFERTKNKIATEEGYVNIQNYKEFKLNGEPNSYCGGVGGTNVEIISNEKMEEIIKNNIESDKSYYTLVSWNKKYVDFIGWDVYWKYSNLNDFKEFIYVDGKPKCVIEDVRIVFGFDS